MSEHNLLKLIDILRTIRDDTVSIESIKQLLLISITNQQFEHIVAWCHTNAYHTSITQNTKRNCSSDKYVGEWTINVTLNDIGTISVTKPMIQLAIKNYYKQCQDFSFLDNIHKKLVNGDSNRHGITITKIPKTNWTQLINNPRTAQNISAEEVMIMIFKCLNIKELSCCRGVCQQWLYDASNQQSVTNIDTFYLRQLIDHFIWYKPTEPSHNSIQNDQMWNKIAPLIKKHGDLYIQHKNVKYMKNIAKYNLDILKNCSSISIDTEHFYNGSMQSHSIVSLLKDWELEKLKTLQITLSNPYSDEDEWFTLDFIGDRNDPLEYVKVIILDDDEDMFQIQWLLSEQLSTQTFDLQTSESDSSTETCTNILNVTQLEICTAEKHYTGDYLLKCCNDIDLSKLECLKFSIVFDDIVTRRESVQRTILQHYQYPEVQIEKIEYHRKSINNTVTIDSKNLDVIKLQGSSFSDLRDKMKLWYEHSKLKLKTEPETINLDMTISAQRGTSWVNALLDLSKSKNLIKLIQYIDEQSKLQQSFKVEFQVQVSHREICDLHQEKWIQLIVKAIQTVFNGDNKNGENSNDFYPFDTSQQFPKIVSLSQNVSVKLLKQKVLTQTVTSARVEVTTTLCVSFNFV